ncbi:MAG TPA: hypothetical protein VLF68_00820 [Candidatus Saccharimonadales bacterium]|nr:hypothetical protein [Candidatus Saccharimonadales bacterium]
MAKLVGGPLLPNTGLAPNENNVPWVPIGIVILLPASLVAISRKRSI